MNEEFLSAVLSNPRSKGGISKVKVRPVSCKGAAGFQLEIFRNNQAFHENLDAHGAYERLVSYMEELRQLQMETCRESYTVLVSKKGKITVRRKKRTLPKERGFCPTTGKSSIFSGRERRFRSLWILA